MKRYSTYYLILNILPLIHSSTDSNIQFSINWISNKPQTAKFRKCNLPPGKEYKKRPQFSQKRQKAPKIKRKRKSD